MNKQAFLDTLGAALSGLPPTDIEERLAFYGEMLDDKMEAGLSEEEAVSSLGTIDEIVSEILSETPLLKIAKERMKPRRRPSPLTSVLLILGSPIWLSLAAAAVAVLLSLYASAFAVIASLWAVFGALVAGGFGCAIAFVALLFGQKGLIGLALLGTALAAFGLSVLAFYGCRAATKGIFVLTKWLVLWIKRLFLLRKEKKEE